MHVARYKATNLRCYKALDIQPHPRLNLIVGANAAGKTTILEGLHLIGRGRSWRTANSRDLAGPDQPDWTSYAEVKGDKGELDRLGLSWREQGAAYRVNGENAKASSLARQLPLQLIDPQGHRIVDEGPGYRRSYLDWGVFHVEHQYQQVWQRYQRSLKQRNQAIRQNQSAIAIGAWDEDLAETASVVTAARARHAAALTDGLPREVERLIGIKGVRLEFQAGWPQDEDFRQLLKEQLPQHRRLGATLQGPHRAELKLWVESHRAKLRMSRGQQKLLVAALVLAQCTLLIKAERPAPVILIDDFGAELSASFQERLADALNHYPGQVFLSAFEAPACFDNQPQQLFHVEQGHCWSGRTSRQS